MSGYITISRHDSIAITSYNIKKWCFTVSRQNSTRFASKCYFWWFKNVQNTWILDGLQNSILVQQHTRLKNMKHLWSRTRLKIAGPTPLNSFYWVSTKDELYIHIYDNIYVIIRTLFELWGYRSRAWYHGVQAKIAGTLGWLLPGLLELAYGPCTVGLIGYLDVHHSL